jgi:hypothetical protein
MRMDKGITLEKEWERFAAHCVPEDATENQKDQLRRAFYAGLSIILMPILDYVTQLSDDDAVKELERFSQEAKAYALTTVMTGALRSRR